MNPSRNSNRSIPIRELLSFQKDPIGCWTRVKRKYGDMVYLRRGPVRFFFVSDPKAVREILITQQRNFAKYAGLTLKRGPSAEPLAKDWLGTVLGNGLFSSRGEVYRRHRRLIQPAFSSQRLSNYTSVMIDYTQRMEQRWQDGMTLDISHEMRSVTLNVIGRTLFGSDMEPHAAKIADTVATVLALQERPTMPLEILFKRLPLPTSRAFSRAMRGMNEAISSMVERLHSGIDDDDSLLSILLAASTDSTGEAGVTEEDVRDHVRTILIAGYVTTALALAWVWHLIGTHAEVEAKLHAELDRVLGARLPDESDVAHLPYTEGVVRETLRLYPSAWIMARRALDECVIGEYTVPANSTMVMSPYLTQRDARFFPNPEQFDPSRWLDRGDADTHGMVYFPFGGGSRRCIGERFALIEAMLIVATVAQRWRLRPSDDKPVQAWLRSAGTLEPKSTIWMRAERRQPAPIRQSSEPMNRIADGMGDRIAVTCPYAAC